MTTNVLLLLLAFQIKHLIADYYLQFPYMYQNKGAKTRWFIPLFDHVAIHAIMTFAIVGSYAIYTHKMSIMVVPEVVLFDFVTHFVTDRWKATRGVGPDTSAFWTHLGIDQMIHHVVGILIVWYITLV